MENKPVNCNEWDIPLRQIVRTYQWIGKNMFSIGKIDFCAHYEFCTYYRILGLRKGPENL